jgi:hypothetical protein
MIKSCDGCKFWSELIARAIGGGPLQAICLSHESGHYGAYVHRGCESFSAGRAIDDPSPTADEINRWAAPSMEDE